MSAPWIIEAVISRDSLQSEPRPCFKPGNVHRVECTTGSLLYKLTQEGVVGPTGAPVPRDDGNITPWWFSYIDRTLRAPDRSKIEIRGVRDVLESAARTQTGIVAFLRARGAVCEDWNRMTHLLLVRLRRPVLGVLGACSGQPVYEKLHLRESAGVLNVSFIGGEQQLFLHGLKPHDVEVVRYGKI
jgi:hypothetical protein